jgi:hypothetical protein
MAHRVFVSYSQADRDCAFELLPCPESYEIPCWTQHWVDAYELPRTPHNRKLCEHIANPPQLVGMLSEPQPDAHNLSHTVRQPRSDAHPAWLTTADQQLLERHLAEHIGPVAKILVSRAAGRSPDWEQLVLTLAAEVESERARRKFVEGCRRRPMPRE